MSDIQTLRAEEILLVVSTAPRPLNGQEIARCLQAAWSHPHGMSSGTLYPLLDRLERRGYVTSTHHGHRRYFGVTARGRHFLRAHEAARQRLRAPRPDDAASTAL